LCNLKSSLRTCYIPLNCYEKKLQILSHCNCGLQIPQSWQHVGNIARDSAQKGITDLELSSTTPLTNGCRNDDMIQLAHSVLSRCFSSSISLMRLFTPSFAIFLTCCNQLNSNLANCGHSRGGIKFGVSFCYNSIIARVRRAFQVSQGSVDTLFASSGKRLYNFATNLFRKRCTKFHQNRPSLMEDITENILVSFFSGHTVHFAIQSSQAHRCSLITYSRRQIRLSVCPFVRQVR